MEYYIKVLVLAIVQGAAELLPVSSSAHVILAQKLLGLNPSAPEQTFLLIMLHTGTMFAVLVYFWPRWKPLLFPQRAGAVGQRSWSKPENEQGDDPYRTRSSTPGQSTWFRHRFLWMTLLATAVTGCGIGLILAIEKVTGDEVEQLFKRLDLIAAALAAVGVFILIAGFLEGRAKRTEIGVGTAVMIGLIQAMCLPFRGFSRSGATISMGLLCGVSRRMAEDFSFALAVLITPAAIGRYAYRLFKDKSFQSWEEVGHLLLPGLVGMVFSFAAGYVALQLLSAALENGRWKYFGFYCLAAAGVLLTFAAYGW